MLDTEPNQPSGDGAADTTSTDSTTSADGAPRRRRRAASRPAGPPAAPAEQGEPGRRADSAGPPEEHPASDAPSAEAAPAKKAAKATRKRTAKKAVAASDDHPATDAPSAEPAPAKKAARSSRTARKRAGATAAPEAGSAGDANVADEADETAAATEAAATGAPAAPGLLFQAPDPVAPVSRRRAAAKAAAPEPDAEETAGDEDPATADEDDETGGPRRRRRGGRGRRGRGRGEPDQAGDSEPGEAATDEDPHDGDGEASADADTDNAGENGEGGESGGTKRRRRRRRRTGSDAGDGTIDDPPNTVTRVREPRKSSRSRDREDDDGVRSVKGSTRLEAKKQRRREGREAGRRRPSVITEAEFLARREAVDRKMIVRQTGERTQIAVLEDGVLVEHYVSTSSSGSALVGNVYLGRVQNVLPSMEAAFVDIGKGRNAVLYAGEVNWDAAGLDGQPRRIELAMKSGDPVLVQVTKDPIGHKGARLTSQVSLAGRYLVLVPGGSMTGISRKLPDTERSRLKAILRKVVPEGAGVIVRTAAEGASEDELSRDVARLTAQWEDIEKKSRRPRLPRRCCTASRT